MINNAIGRKVEDDNTLSCPIIGILCWEKGKVPRGLEQLAELPGNVTNPQTFPFSVRYERIPGATSKTIVEEPSVKVLNSMVKAAQKMERDGVKAITTSCGYNAVFQRELANAVSIPVFTSSLMQIPLVYKMLQQGQMVGVITARKGLLLTSKHLQAVGITRSIPLRVVNLEEAVDEWASIFTTPQETVSLRKISAGVIQLAKNMTREDPNIGAIVLECTDLPPFASAIRKATRLPVFDIVTLTNMVYEAVVRNNFK